MRASLRAVPGRAVVWMAVWLWARMSPQASAVSISNLVAEIEESGYRQRHESLFVSNGMCRGFTADTPLRVPTNQHDAARDRIDAAFVGFGLTTITQQFSFSKSWGGPTYSYSNACNIIAVLPGTDTNAGYYILGAHYDSVDTGHGNFVNSPGADDNASGTAGLVEIARAIAPRSFRASIVLAAFDAEEKTVQGSSRFVNTRTTAIPNGDNSQFAAIYRGSIHGMVSLDMIGFNPGGSTSNRASLLGGSPAVSATKASLGAALVRYGGLSWINGGQNNSSDHGPFFQTTPSIDACVLIEDDWATNPHYHKSTDSTASAAFIDYAFATRMTRGAAGYLAEQAVPVPTATVAASIPEAAECGPVPGAFAFSLAEPETSDVTLYYAAGGSAAEGDDYDALSGSVVIPAGETSAVVEIHPLSDALSEGDETVVLTLQARPEYGTRGSGASLTLRDLPVDEWRRNSFTPEELADAGVSGDHADPDRNGIPNLIEYALGRHPRATNTHPPFVACLTNLIETACYVATFTRRTNLVDASCSLVVATDPHQGPWLSGPDHVEETVLSTTGDTETIRARVIDPTPETADRVFIRLRVTRP